MFYNNIKIYINKNIIYLLFKIAIKKFYNNL